MTNENLLALSKNEFMRLKIILSIKNLLHIVPLKKVTVTSVCEDSGVARSSFYNLFSDIDDAINWEFERIIGMEFNNYVISSDWRSDMSKQMAVSLSGMQEDAVFFQRVSQQMSYTAYNEVFLHTRRLRVQWFLSSIEMWQGKPADALCAFGIEFFVSGESDTVANWFAAGLKESPEEVSRKIYACIPEYLGKIIDSAITTYLKRQQAANIK